MRFVVEFESNVARQLNECVQLSALIWKDAKPDISAIKITAGNYAGYGSYLARCHEGGLIEIPVGNRTSLLDFNSDNQLVHANEDHRLLIGTVMHEVGHHVVNTAKRQPWRGNVSVGSSTHLNAAWIWICCTGWNHIHGSDIKPSEFARLAKHDEALRDHLPKFNPYFPPPVIAVVTVHCEFCGSTFSPKRSDAKFCSSKCRVYANRQSVTAG